MGALVLSVRRSKEYIGLNLSAVVWKALVGQEVHREDLDGVDVLLTRSMQDIRTIDQKGERCNAFFLYAIIPNAWTVSLSCP